MNYLKELNAFHNQLVFNPLSGSAVSLWSILMHFNNRCGWKEQFSVPATMLQSLAGIKESSFKRARDELQQKRYIRVISRGGNQAAIYQMISQVQHAMNVTNVIETDSDQHTDEQMNDNTDHNANDNDTSDQTNDPCMNPQTTDSKNGNLNDNTDDSADPFFKQKEILNKGKQKQIIATTETFKFYQENFGLINPFVSDDLTNWVKDIGEPLVLHAMKRALEQNKANWGYTKGILQSWVRKGITTVDEANADDAAFKNQQRQKFQARTVEVVPEWFHERKRKKLFVELRKEVEPKLDPVAEAAERAEIDKLLAEFTSRKASIQVDD